ncbi:MAG TPA: hypothetical protein VIH63_12135 [Xanthobacteraceae bacterium]
MGTPPAALRLTAAMFVLTAPASIGTIASPAVAQVAAAKQFTFTIKQRKLDTANNVVRVRKGDLVELLFTGDEAAELHLHGYDIKFELKPNAPANIQFTARIAGRFPLEVHRFGTDATAGRSHIAGPLLYVEVLPQ